jgi:Zn-dependent protease/CBS domain-containing protein
MTETFRLGRIAGIRVGLNWSVLAIFLLIAFGLAGQRFPAAYPGEPAVAYWAAGLAAAVVFFVSLLAHELAHAVVARRHGIAVEGITLWLFGGVARIRGEAPDPGTELRVAGVGPLVSLVLGVVFLAAAAVLDMTTGGGLAVAAVGWLGGINLALAVFNVVPAAPLDGGRLLRAFLWWRTGDRLMATQRASQAGRVFGWLLVGLGLLSVLTQGSLGGLWLAFIGWFLVGAATAEGQQANLRAALAGLPVRQVMTPDVTTVPASMTVQELLDGELARHRPSTFPLTTDTGALAGLVTLDRIRRVPPAERATTALTDIACPLDEVATATPTEPVADLLPRLNACADRRALVLQDGRLVGIVTPTDISHALEWHGLRARR